MDGYIVSYRWDFGDGTGSTDKDPVHTYYQTGTYYVKLWVYDNYGASGTALVTVIVEDEPDVVPPTGGGGGGDDEREQRSALPVIALGVAAVAVVAIILILFVLPLFIKRPQPEQPQIQKQRPLREITVYRYVKIARHQEPDGEIIPEEESTE